MGLRFTVSGHRTVGRPGHGQRRGPRTTPRRHERRPDVQTAPHQRPGAAEAAGGKTRSVNARGHARMDECANECVNERWGAGGGVGPTRRGAPRVLSAWPARPHATLPRPRSRGLPILHTERPRGISRRDAAGVQRRLKAPALPRDLFSSEGGPGGIGRPRLWLDRFSFLQRVGSKERGLREVAQVGMSRKLKLWELGERRIGQGGRDGGEVSSL